jgi:hypothetical protein
MKHGTFCSCWGCGFERVAQVEIAAAELAAWVAETARMRDSLDVGKGSIEMLRELRARKSDTVSIRRPVDSLLID